MDLGTADPYSRCRSDKDSRNNNTFDRGFGQNRFRVAERIFISRGESENFSFWTVSEPASGNLELDGRGYKTLPGDDHCSRSHRHEGLLIIPLALSDTSNPSNFELRDDEGDLALPGKSIRDMSFPTYLNSIREESKIRQAEEIERVEEEQREERRTGIPAGLNPHPSKKGERTSKR